MSWVISDARYDGIPCSENREEIIRSYINNKLFICPRCGMVFSRNSRHNFGDCCSFCAKDEDLRKIQENKEHVRTQMQELQEEIERRLKDESIV